MDLKFLFLINLILLKLYSFNMVKMFPLNIKIIFLLFVKNMDFQVIYSWKVCQNFLEKWIWILLSMLICKLRSLNFFTLLFHQALNWIIFHFILIRFLIISMKVKDINDWFERTIFQDNSTYLTNMNNHY